MFQAIGKEIITKLNASANFIAANGSSKVFPVIIPQGVHLPINYIRDNECK